MRNKIVGPGLEKKFSVVKKRMSRGHKEKTDKSLRGNAAQFFVAGELCRRELPAVVTMGNTVHTDILCSNREATKFAHIQVKSFRLDASTCTVGMKVYETYGENFFWVLAGIPESNSDKAFKYYIIPAAEVKKNVCESHEKWLARPNKKTGKKNEDNTVRIISLPPRTCENGWSIDKYLNKWSLIEEKLKA